MLFELIFLNKISFFITRSSDSHHGNKFISHLLILVFVLRIFIIDFLPKYGNLKHS